MNTSSPCSEVIIRRHRRIPSRLLLASAIASCLLAATPAVLSQTSSARLRGQVTVDAAPGGNTKITVTNTPTGLTRSAVANAEGAYTLGGLPPGTYKVDVDAGGQSSSQVVQLQVGQTATLDLGVGGQAAAVREVESVTVTAPQLFETKTSEVASYVSTRQIEMLPQNSRNFLAFADTVPGVQFSTNGTDGSSELRSGAQAANGVNVAADPQLGREIHVIDNDLKSPYADQFSLGMRNRVVLWNADWNTSATLSHIISNDGIVFLLGNRRRNGEFRADPGSIWGDVPWDFGIPGLGNLILAKIRPSATSNSTWRRKRPSTPGPISRFACAPTC